MTQRPSTHRRQAGFTLLEVMLVIFTMGVVLAANMVARNVDAQRNSVSDAVLMDSVVAALFDYARRNHRLPCPDINGDGFEDASEGVCGAPSTKSGGVPYLTLEMSGDGAASSQSARMVYGVYRGGGLPARDLTLDSERTVPPHVEPHAGFRNLDDFKQALINAMAASQPVNDSEIFVTGNDFNSGISNCASNRVANMAFVVAFAGEGNADGLGGAFDGVHLTSASWNGSSWTGVATNTCFVGPRKPLTPTFDDDVRAVSFVELIGVLSQ
jgi:competence protein ComGC